MLVLMVFLNGLLGNDGKVIIIGHFQVHIFGSSYCPTNWQQISVKVNSISLIVIIVCDLSQNAISPI